MDPTECLPLFAYQNPYTPPAPVAAWPLPRSLWEAHLDQETLVTFTAVVPLKVLVNESLNSYLEQAFDSRVELGGVEARVIGHEPSEEFDEALLGDVVLQVSAALYTK